MLSKRALVTELGQFIRKRGNEFLGCW